MERYVLLRFASLVVAGQVAVHGAEGGLRLTSRALVAVPQYENKMFLLCPFFCFGPKNGHLYLDGPRACTRFIRPTGIARGQSNMKAPNRSKEPRGGKTALYGAAEPSRAETAVFAALGLAGLIAVGIAVIWGSVPTELKGTLVDGRSLPMATYVRSGQLTADMRTAAAALHYLLESEAALATNSSETQLTQKNITTPTNATTAKPKA